MKAEITPKENSMIEIKLVIPASEVEKALPEAAKHLSKEMKIPGFRPGHVPVQVVEQKVGKTGIWEEASQIVLPKFYAEAVKENDLEPIGRPEVTVKKMAPGNDLEFQLEVAVLPQFELPQYKGLSAEKREVKVDEKKVDETLENLQKMRSKFHNTENAAKKGDRVEVDLVVKVDGKVIEDGQSENMPLVLGDEKFIPGFEDQVTGLKKGDHKTFRLTFPEKYHNKNLQNKEATFEVTVKQVQEVEKPKLDDEFAKTLGGDFKTIDAVKGQIRDNMKEEATEKEKQRYEMALFDQIIDAVKMDVPDVLLDAETNKMYQELEQQIQQQGMEIEKYLESMKTSEEKLKEGFADQAVRRVKAGLILRKIGREEKLEIPKEEIDQEIEKAAGGQTDPEVTKIFQSDRYREYVEEQLKNRKVFDIIVSEAKDASTKETKENDAKS